MTFLNPLVLFGLATAAIPIILHLLNIRKLRTIEFSTLTFLKELQRSTMRRVRLRQWLLLILRTLLVILIVLAFSRPAVRGTLGSAGTHAKTTIVIILDDTYSMSLQNEQGTFLKQAQGVALHLADMLKEGDDAFLLRVSELPQATISEPTHDIQKLKDAIRHTEVSFRHRTIEDALRLSSRLLLSSKNFNKEIYVVTDNQKSTLISSLHAEKPPAGAKLFDVNARVFLIPLSEKSFENTGVERVEVPPTLFQKGKPFTVRAAVRNYGSVRIQNHLVNLFFDGTRVMQKSVSLDAGERTTIDFIATPQRSGFLSGNIDLEEDAFDGDNKAYFTVAIPDQLTIVLSSSDQKSSSYIRLALGVSGKDVSSTPLLIKELSPQQLTSASFAAANVVILSNVAFLSSSQADELSEFLSQGGGIIFFPGDLMNLTFYNNWLLPRLGLPSFLPPVRRPASANGFVSFDKIDYDHAVFRGMFENAKGIIRENKSIESPRVFTTVRFVNEQEIRAIVSLSDGTPFLWEKVSGVSRLMGYAAAPTVSWSDFPLKPVFVPLLYQSILYAASGRNLLSPPPTAVVGDEIDIPLAQLKNRSSKRIHEVSQTLRIIDPDGKESMVQPSAPGTRPGESPMIVPYTGSSLPGVYTVLRSNDTLMRFPVNVDRAESEGERSSSGDFTTMAERCGIEPRAVVLLRNPATIDEAVLQSRFGTELWKYFLVAALIVALVEMIVAREAKQQA